MQAVYLGPIHFMLALVDLLVKLCHVELFAFFRFYIRQRLTGSNQVVITGSVG